MSGFTLDDVRDSFGDDLGEQLRDATNALGRLDEEHAERTRLAKSDEVDLWSELGRASASRATNAEQAAEPLRASFGWQLEQLASRAAGLCAMGPANFPLERELGRTLPKLVAKFQGILDAVLTLPPRKTERSSKALANQLDKLALLQATAEESGAIQESDPEDGFAFGSPEPASGPSADAPARTIAELIEALRSQSSGRSLWSQIGTAPDPFEQLVHAFHAIAGTSSLVGLDVLAIPARRVEELCERAQLARRQLQKDAQSVVAAWDLLSQRDLDLPESSEELEQLRDELIQLLAEPTEESFGEQVVVFGSEAPEDPEEFAFDRPGGFEPAAPEVDPEMVEIFREEAIEVAGRVRFTLAELESGSDSKEQVHELERAFHQLKGASATIGLERVAGRAYEQECEFASLFEAGLLPSEEQLLTARAAFEGILASVDLDAESLLALPEPEEEGFSFEEEPSEQLQPLAQDSTWQSVPLEVQSDEELLDAFREEAEVLCDGIAHSVVALEEGAPTSQVVSDLMRQVHTLKGALNTVGLDPLGQVLHEVETVLEGVEADPGRVAPSAMAGLADWSLGLVRSGMSSLPTGYVQVAPGWVSGQAAGILRGDAFEAPEEPLVEQVAGGDPAAGEQLETARFVRVAATRLDGLMDLAGELVVARSRMNRRVYQLESFQENLGSARKRLLETVVDFVDRYEFAGLAGQNSTTQRLVAPAGAGSSGGGLSLGSGGGGSWNSGDGQESALASSVESLFSEIELDRYEDVNILARTLREIGDDIVEVSAQISGELAQFREESDVFSGLVSGLQTEVTQARMVPVEQLFLRLRGPVRDAAQREQKAVSVRVKGESVTIDKTLIDDLYTPLLHLVRNAVSHGIESTEARRAAGKDIAGLIRLEARQRSGQILLEIADDGGGLDLEGLRAKGAAAGLVEADTPLDDPRIPELIFASGLSTRNEVSDVAGRGVGCDVLRREVERMNGHVVVETRPGHGTTFRVTLPNTLAIYRALMVRQGESTYAVPLAFAERVLDLRDLLIEEEGGARRVQVGEESLPLHSLSTLLGEKAEPSWTRREVVLLRLGDQGLLLDIDGVLGQEEIVVKPLGDVLAQHPLFSGMTLTSEGGMRLILDIPGLFDSVSEGRFGAVLGPVSGESTTREGELEGATEELLAPQAVRRQVEILYVDDSLSVRKAAEKFLRAAGASVTVAVDGQDAMEKLRIQSFDLIFTDLEMPRMHGYDLIREIRFVPAYSELPVIVVTSRSAEKHRNQAKKLGASDYVTKPFNQDVLAEKLRTHLRVDLEGDRLVIERRSRPRDGKS